MLHFASLFVHSISYGLLWIHIYCPNTPKEIYFLLHLIAFLIVFGQDQPGIINKSIIIIPYKTK